MTWRLPSVRQDARWAKHVFRLQRVRLRLDRTLSDLMGRARGRRVLATACWHFPIYSQTFVYQELTQLIHGGFRVRFLYSELNRRDPLPRQFRPVWRARRRLSLHDAVCEESYAYFMRRMPDKVSAIVDLLCRQSGMTPEAVREHYHFRQAFAFARLAEAYRPDYLHSYFFYEGTLFALVASWLLDIPRGVSCYTDHMLDDYVLKVVGLHLRQCSLVIATSDRIKRELLTIEPRAVADQILAKPNGINASHFPVVRRPGPAKGAPFSLVTVSRIEPKKGLVHLVEAISLLRARGHAVEWRLIGGVDASEISQRYDQTLRDRIAALGLGSIVHLEGRRTETEINAFFRTAHAFVAPFVETDSGDKDGVPTALLEGMASGLPVVATDAGSILEVIEPGKQGVIVAQRNSEALAEAIAGLIHDADRRTTYGEAAARKVRERFDATTVEQIFHERLSALLAAPTQLTEPAGR